MEVRQLRYFVAVAQELHFGRAAERLHMAQPPLSAAIRTLEGELGVRLLERTTRRVDLTPAGEVYLRHALDVLARLERAADDVRRIGSGEEGRLVIGCVGSASYSLLPQLSRAIRAERPGVDVQVRGEMLTADQVRALRDGTIDLALLRRPDDAAGLTLTGLREDRMMLAVADDHRLAHRRRVALHDLAGESLLTHPGGGRSRMHAMVTAALAADGVSVGEVREVAETSTLLTFVAADLGLAVLPEPARALGIPGVRWLPLSRVPALELLAAHRAEGPDPVVAAALAILARVVRSG